MLDAEQRQANEHALLALHHFNNGGEIPLGIAIFAGKAGVEAARQCAHGHRALGFQAVFHCQPEVFEHQLGHKAGLVVVAGRGGWHNAGYRVVVLQ